MENYLKYWTGVNSQKKDLYNFTNYKIRCYFDNDSDELINYKGNNGLVNLEVYRQMVRSLKGMGYNAIDIHDQLGRAEFYLWDSYKKYWNYKPDINHIEKIIDIIHEEGLLVQIPMYLAWAFNPLNEQHECWFEYGKTWLLTWEEYMNSPLGKADIFLLRPRSPIYDVKYRCTCDKCQSVGTGKIMTEVFEKIEKIILNKKPNATLICDLYGEGYDLFKERTFKVSKKWLLLYADNGFGKIIYTNSYADDTYKKGIYLHGGFWLNHTVMDSHFTPLMESIKKAKKLQLTDYILVNGQSFKNFILLNEGIIDMCFKEDEFDKEVFIANWFKRVLNINKQDVILKTISYLGNLEKFHIAMAVRKAYLSPNDDIDRGFQANMINVLYPLIYHYNKKEDSSYEFVDEKFSNRKKEVLWDNKKAIRLYDQGVMLLNSVIDIEKQIEDSNSKIAFNDQFVFPMSLLEKQLKLIKTLFEGIKGNKTKEQVLKCHNEFYDLAANGSKFRKFKTWSHPKNSRMHHPIPETKDVFI